MAFKDQATSQNTFQAFASMNGKSPAVHRVRRQFIRIGISNDYFCRKIEMQKDSDMHPLGGSMCRPYRSIYPQRQRRLGNRLYGSHHDRRRGTRVWSDSDGRGSGGTVYRGAYSWKNSAGGGVCYPGRIAMGGPNWTVYSGPKNQPYNNQPSGASLCSVNRPWDGMAALFVATHFKSGMFSVTTLQNQLKKNFLRTKTF